MPREAGGGVARRGAPHIPHPRGPVRSSGKNQEFWYAAGRAETMLPVKVSIQVSVLSGTRMKDQY